MEVNSVTSNLLNSQIQAEQTEALYEVKLIKMQQESEAIVGDILQDTVEISNEAMQKFMAERV